MESLEELLVEELQDLYSAEKQLVKALPSMVKGAQSESLKTALTEHLAVTKAQVTRLDEVFALVGQKPKAKHCKGMEGLLAEGSEGLESQQPSVFRDLALIGAAQRVEHYEMAAYGTARAIAEQCGMSEAVELLDQTFEEEEEADSKLTEVAEELYAEAGSMEEGEDDEEAPEKGNMKMASGKKGAASKAPIR